MLVHWQTSKWDVLIQCEQDGVYESPVPDNFSLSAVLEKLFSLTHTHWRGEPLTNTQTVEEADLHTLQSVPLPCRLQRGQSTLSFYAGWINVCSFMSEKVCCWFLQQSSANQVVCWDWMSGKDKPIDFVVTVLIAVKARVYECKVRWSSVWFLRWR